MLKAGVYILEMIDLSGVEPGDYELVCLTFRMEHGDAGPCRAILWPLRWAGYTLNTTLYYAKVVVGYYDP